MLLFVHMTGNLKVMHTLPFRSSYVAARGCDDPYIFMLIPRLNLTALVAIRRPEQTAATRANTIPPASSLPLLNPGPSLTSRGGCPPGVRSRRPFKKGAAGSAAPRRRADQPGHTVMAASVTLTARLAPIDTGRRPEKIRRRRGSGAVQVAASAAPASESRRPVPGASRR